MKKLFKIKNLKTSDKIVFLFTIFNFIWLIILLLWINIIYFLVWHTHQKDMSLQDIDKKYIDFKIDKDLIKFKKFILEKDTIIISEKKGETLFCSLWIETKVHKNILEMWKRFYYKIDDKIYFIFSKKYKWLWEVKIFFDTTPYIKVQFLIIKFSLLLIAIALFIFYFLWKRITKYGFVNLNEIVKKAKNLDIEKDFEKIEIVWNKDDEINILAQTINKSFCHIKKQTGNLKQFITDVSHEFKTPLMIINSQIDLYNKKLEKGKLTMQDTEKLLKNIKEKTKKLNNLLETFLFFSRIENNIENLEKKEVDLWKYLETFTQKYLKENNYSGKKINIKYNFEKDIKIFLEENTFNILFENLLSNAIKFSEKNINIEIWCDKKSFWISDNWIWISKEEFKNIWKKFFREDTKKEWFWVWLFLVKRLILLYNWKIKVETKVDLGTKFIVKF